MLGELRGRDGEAIVLLHGWPSATAEVLPALLAELAAMGAELVTVDAVGVS